MDKQYLRKVGFNIASAVLCILIVVYIIYHVILSFNESVETEATGLATVRDTVSLQGYVIREEAVLTSGVTGDITYPFADGELAPAGSSVASIYSSAGSGDIRSRVSQIDRQINILENSSIANAAASSDSMTLDRQISGLFTGIQKNLGAGSTDYAFRRRDELLTLLNKKQIADSIYTGYGDQISALTSEKSSLTSSLSNASETIYTDKSGYFYSAADGYEAIFQSSKIDAMNISDFDAMVNSTPAVYTNAVGKIVTNYVWYLACETTSDEVQYYNEGGSYIVVFPFSSDTEISMTLYRTVNDTASGRLLLIFRTSDVPKDFNFLRCQTVDVVQTSYTGYRIPVSAVRVIDGKQGVYILDGNIIRFREIDTLKEIDGYMIVAEQDKEEEGYEKKLGLYDLVITRGTKLYENKVIN